MNKTKRKIFETSMKLFAEKGYDATSIEEITATVGVAKGTLYYHFSSKEEIFNFLRECNKYIDDTTPWVLAKEGKLERLQTVLYNLLESIRISSVLLTPFMPTTTEKIFKQLNTNLNTYDTLNEFGALENNHKVGQIEVLFKRIEIEK